MDGWIDDDDDDRTGIRVQDFNREGSGGELTQQLQQLLLTTATTTTAKYWDWALHLRCDAINMRYM